MIYIGDTPEQLGSCNVADAVIIGGKVYTKDLIAELEREKAELMAQVEALKPLARRCLWGAISWNDHNFEPLHKYCRESAKEAGIFTVDQANALLESPAQCLNQIKAEAGKAGFIAGWEACQKEMPEPFNVMVTCNYAALSERYGESIAKGGVMELEEIKTLVLKSKFISDRHFKEFEEKGLNSELVKFFNEWMTDYPESDANTAFHFAGVLLLGWPVGG